MIEKLFKQTFFIYLTEFLSRGFGFLTTILIAKYLSTSALGQISYAASLVFLLAVFTDLGYAPVAVKKFAQAGKDDKTALNPGFTLKFLSSAAAFILIIFYLGFAGAEMDRTVFLLVLLSGVNLIVSSLSFPYQFSLRGLRLFQYENLFKLGASSVCFALLLLSLKVRPDAVVIGGVIPIVASLFMLFSFYLLNARLGVVRPGLTFDAGRLSGFFRECLPFSVAVIITLFQNKLDIVILKNFTDFQAVGVYVLAYKGIEAIAIIPNVIFTVTFPVIAAHFTDRAGALRDSVRLMTKYLFVLSVPVAVVLFFTGGKAVALIMGPAYADAGSLLELLAPVLVPVFLYSATSGTIMAGPKPSANTLIQLGAALSYFLLLFILVPSKGARGLVYSLIFVEWAALLAKMVYINRKICGVDYAAMGLKVLGAAAAAVFPFFFFGSFASAVIFLAVYSAVLVISGFVDKKGFGEFYKLAGAFGG